MVGYHSEKLIAELSDLAMELRRTAVEMVFNAQSGHPGGSLSAAHKAASLKH